MDAAAAGRARSDQRFIALRQLPAAPSLEFERKQARHLLRRLREGDAESLNRLRAAHPRRETTELDLADAQLVIAREYGFASWPRLVSYFADLEREGRAHPRAQADAREFRDQRVRSILAEHRDRRIWIGRLLSAFVPRFYGMAPAETLDHEITIEDARVVVARENRAANWEQLLERDGVERAFQDRMSGWKRHDDPYVRAGQAIRADDLVALQRIVAEHPTLLTPTEADIHRGTTLITAALAHEAAAKTLEARRITDWLEARGFDVQLAMNRRLLWAGPLTADEASYLLERGADPNWVGPDGYIAVEHLLCQPWRSPVMEMLLACSKPRRALWISAALGDVAAMRTFFGPDGRPTEEAYRERPPIGLLGPQNMPMLLEPDHVEIMLEVAWIALWNQQTGAIEVLLDHGLPIDDMSWSKTLLYFAVVGEQVDLVELLVKRGASVDLRYWWPNNTARELSRDVFLRNPASPVGRRILELCGGGDPEAILAEADANRAEPRLAERTLDLVELAGDDAARQGQPTIEDENLFMATARLLPDIVLGVATHCGARGDELARSLRPRMHDAGDRVDRAKLPLGESAQAVIRAAVERARQRRNHAVTVMDLIASLFVDDEGAASRQVRLFGADLEKIRERLSKA